MPTKNINCHICKTPASAEVPGDAEIVTCPRCGRYRISGTAIRLLQLHPLDEIQVANASGWLRQSGDQIVSSYDFDWLRNIPTPSIDEQATYLLRHFAKTHPIPGRVFRIDLNDTTNYSVAWAVDGLHLNFLVQDYLAQDRRYLSLVTGAGGDFHDARITPGGWAYLASLDTPNRESPFAFVAMSFNPAMLDARRQGLIAGIESAGYKALLIDEQDFDNDVVDEILANIRRSRFVVADFTDHRNGVYFEAGFAQGLGLPVVRTCRENDLKGLLDPCAAFAGSSCLAWCLQVPREVRRH